MKMDELIQAIDKADADAIDYILDAVIKRKRKLYPDWEIIYCAARKGETDGPEELIRSAWEFDKQLRKRFETSQQLKCK